MARFATRKGRLLVAGVAAASMAAGAGALLGPGLGNASSHREAPIISGDPQHDNTDTYAFVSPDDPNSVTLIANWIPFEEPAGGPTFYPFADGSFHDINVDSDGNGIPELTYRWTFSSSYQDEGTFLYNTGEVTSLDDPDLNFRQTYNLDLIEGVHGERSTRLITNAPVAPSHTGDAGIPNYATLRDEAVTPGLDGVRSYAGQADDPFFIDLRVFDLLYGANLSEVGNDTATGFNLNTIVLQVPKTEIAFRNDPVRNPVIGVWSATQKRGMQVGSTNGSGALSEVGRRGQVSRLGFPLFSELALNVGNKDRYNASTPANDQQFGRFARDPEVPRRVEATYGIPNPNRACPGGAGRPDLVQFFLTGFPGMNSHSDNSDAGARDRLAEMIRLNINTPAVQEGDPGYSPLGVIGGDNSGFPNGRRLSDDIIDVTVQVYEGELLCSPNELQDGVPLNDVEFTDEFPYIGLPHSGSDLNADPGQPGDGLPPLTP